MIFAKHLFYVAKKNSCSLCVFCKLAVFTKFFLYQRSSILFWVDMSSRSLNVIPSIIFPIFVVIHFCKRFLSFFPKIATKICLQMFATTCNPVDRSNFWPYFRQKLQIGPHPISDNRVVCLHYGGHYTRCKDLSTARSSRAWFDTWTLKQ